MGNSTKQLIEEANGIHLGNWYRIPNSTVPNQSEQTIFTQQDFYLLIYLVNGKAYRKIVGHNSIMYEGDILLISPNTPYLLYGDENENTGYYYCLISKEIGNELIESLHISFPTLKPFFTHKTPYIQISDSPQKKIRNSLIRMLEEYTRKPNGFEIYIKNCLSNILINLFRIAISPKADIVVSGDDSTIDHAILYIKRNLQRKITLDEIAAERFITKTYLCRLFKRHLGQTVVQYINLQRIKHIKDSLANTNRPIPLIQNDFELNPEYLNRIFHENTGYSMIEYRRKYRTEHVD